MTRTKRRDNNAASERDALADESDTTKETTMLTFDTLRKAQNFLRGFCVPRVIVKRGRKFAITSPAYARKSGWKVVAS